MHRTVDSQRLEEHSFVVNAGGYRSRYFMYIFIQVCVENTDSYSVFAASVSSALVAVSIRRS